MQPSTFTCKQFTIDQTNAAFKVGTDGILLGSWLAQTDADRWLDIGTGSGLLALMLAQRWPMARVDAVEVDSPSARQATVNFANSPFSSRLLLFEQDVALFQPPDGQTYDGIVCNPPFFDAAHSTPSPKAGKRRARHTVSLSYEALLAQVARLLGPNGRFHTILPMQTAAVFTVLAHTVGLHCTRQTAVRPKPSKPPHRALLQFEREKRPLQTASLTIETETRHRYTSEYIALAKPFLTSIA